MNTEIEEIHKAYLSENKELLCEALNKFLTRITRQAREFGPAVPIFQLYEDSILRAILNRLDVGEDEGKVAERLAFIAGAVSNTLQYFRIIASKQKVDEADAQLSDCPNSHDLANLVLKAVFSRSGERTNELIDVVARVAKAEKSVVKSHILELLDMGLIEQIRVVRTFNARRSVLHYRITPLGEAVLARRSSRYALPRFIVDLAGHDSKLREEMQEEISRVWPKE